MDKLYSCEDVATRYGVKTLTIWDWIRKKKIPAIKIGKEYRVREADLIAFERNRSTVNECTTQADR